jgi:hypothetical protein
MTKFIRQPLVKSPLSEISIYDGYQMYDVRYMIDLLVVIAS